MLIFCDVEVMINFIGRNKTLGVRKKIIAIKILNYVFQSNWFKYGLLNHVYKTCTNFSTRQKICRN